MVSQFSLRKWEKNRIKEENIVQEGFQQTPSALSWFAQLKSTGMQIPKQ